MEEIRELKENEEYFLFNQWYSEIEFFGIADSKEGIKNIIKRMNKEFVKLIINDDDDDVFFMDIKDNETDEKDTIIVKILNKNC